MNQPFSDERAEQVQGTLALAHLMLTSLITTSAGAFLAVLTFAAQAKPFPSHLRDELSLSLAGFGAALFLSLAASILGYIYQRILTYGNESMLPFWLAVTSIALALVGLIGGGIEGFWLVVGTVAP